MTDDGLSGLRGAVRDGVAVIENLANLLHARRIGPRALSQALPVVRAGCATLSTAIDALGDSLGRVLATDRSGAEAVQALLRDAGDRVRGLSAELVRSEREPVDARERLMLDGLVTDVAAHLAGLVRILGLLEHASSPRATALDFADLVREERKLTGARSMRVPVIVDLRVQPAMVADARIVLDVLHFAVATVARAGVATPKLTVEAEADGRLVVRVGPPGAEDAAQAATTTLLLPERNPLPREDEVVCAAARHGGIELAFSPDQRTATLRL